VKPGTNRIMLNADGMEHTRIVTVEPDPRTRVPGTTVHEAEELRKLMKLRP
jgi:hypothetical protein